MKIESPTNGLASKEIAELRAELRESTEKLAAISDSKAISDTKRCREDLAWIGDSTWSVEQWREEIIVKTGGLRARVVELEGALEFYANPETYHGIMFMADKPTGGFDEDFGEDPEGEYDRPMPGVRARKALEGK